MDIHFKKPARRHVQARARYTEYREDLRADFNGACGYCDDNDLRADRISFHIDHFAPQKRFPHLENTYSNLVYACRFCNMRKSDHWIGNDPTVHHDGTRGFVDPCSNEYDQHLERDSTGRIIGKSELGRYIVRRLNLNLLRHELLWKARRARTLRGEIRPLLDQLKASGHPKIELYTELLERFLELTDEIEAYELSAIKG